jgi:DNA-binding transcriptional LysR family regulator
MFDARLLTVFREVATRGSFSEAAAALSFTQPAVSQQIARLERELGTRLLSRNARGVTLTPAGEVLLRHAETMLAQLREAEAEVQAVAGVERPRLRVGAFASAAASIMPPALAELRAAHPAAAVTMRVTEMPDSLESLRTGELDLSVIIDAISAPLDFPSDVEVFDLFDDPFLAALPYSHRLAGRGAVALSELRDEEWMVTGVANSCPDTTIVLDACRDAGFTPQASFSSDDYAAIQGMVASGMGVAIIPSLALGNAREDIAIRPLRGATPQRRVRAAIAADRPSALADALLEILRASGRDRRWAGRQLAAVA